MVRPEQGNGRRVIAFYPLEKMGTLAEQKSGEFFKISSATLLCVVAADLPGDAGTRGSADVVRPFRQGVRAALTRPLMGAGVWARLNLLHYSIATRQLSH